MGGSSMNYRTEHCVIEVVLWPVQLEVFLDERGAISNQLHSRDDRSCETRQLDDGIGDTLAAVRRNGILRATGEQAGLAV
jgi:hypothetical protein